MSSGNNEEEELVSNLRAIIISSKGGLNLNDVRGDYRETHGTEIPLKVLGYSSLDQFFKSKSKDFTLIGNRVEAVAKSSSAHISSLVSEQNAKKKIRSRMGAKKRRRPIHSGYHSVYKQAIVNVPLKKHSYEIAPKFSKQVTEKQILSIGNKKKDIVEKRSKTEKDEPAPKTFKKDIAEKAIFKDRAENKIENNQFLSRTLRNFGAITKDSRLAKKKVEPKDVFEMAGNEDAIPFDAFEDYYVPTALPSELKKTRSTKYSSSRSRDSSECSSKASSSPVRKPNDFENQTRTRSKNGVQSRLDALKSSVQQKLAHMKTDPEEEGSLPVKEKSDHEAKLKELCLSKGLPPPTWLVTLVTDSNGVKKYGCKVEIGENFCFKTDFPQAGTLEEARESVSKKASKALEESQEAPIVDNSTTIEDWIAELEKLCSLRTLPDPVFEVFATEKDSSLFLSKVSLGKDYTFSSFPVEQPDEKSARQVAAKKAYNFLCSEYKFSNSKLTEREKLVTERLLELIGTSYGIWRNKLPGLYEERFGEPLDENWFEIIQKFPDFEVTSVLDEERCIIYKKKEIEWTTESNDSIENFPNVPPPLKLPASVHWEIYVVNVHDSSRIACRLIGDEYSEAYDLMMTHLELNPPNQKVSLPSQNGYYAVNVDEVWNRVQFLESKENGRGSVFFIDNGEEEDIEISKLYYLDPSFLDLPPQAISLSLHELDCFADDEGVKLLLLDKLLGNIFIAEIVTLSDLGQSVASVVFWDTSTEDDINVNKMLLDLIVSEILPPTLEKTNQLKEVFVSEITDKGDLYLITNKESVSRIARIIFKQTATGCDKNAVCDCQSINFTDLYLTRCEKTKKYNRAKVLRKEDADHVDVQFIDSGVLQRASIGDVYSLSKMSTCLARIPPQTLQVRLVNLNNFNAKIAAKIRELIPPDELVLAKAVGFEGKLPLVELFKRSSSDNALTSVNNLILEESRSQKKESKSRRKSVVVGLENVLCQKLMAPFIPAVGRYFDVFVTLAASPDLFTIQPLRSQSELYAFMEKLQEFCGRQHTSPPLRGEDCVIGELYAAKHEDGNWYRGCLHLDLGSSMFSVYLCDFGDFVLVPLERLMLLPIEFQTFPYQAIRAKLSGIAPVNKDWSAIDCIHFQNLVVDKEFVSTVVEINRDPVNPNNIMLGLILVDTSGNEDIYIHQLLIDKKCAITKKS